MEEKKIVVVIPSYKNSRWYEKNLKSVIEQQYDNFRAVYTDDCSPDGTGSLVEEYLSKNDNKKRVQLIKNTTRIGALENLYNMINSCEDDEIIVTLDGDDWLATDKVLDRVNQEYTSDVWMTYGQFKEYPGDGAGCSVQIPKHIIQSQAFRRYRWCSSHLRTFYAWLFKRINKEDLKYNGSFFSMAWDLAFMFPMLEMSGHRSRYIPDILYIYNVENPINDSKVNLKLQQSYEMLIRRKKPYALIEAR